MMKLKKLSDTELATLYSRLHKVFMTHENIFYKNFESLYCDLQREINIRNRGKIYKECCRVLKLRNCSNQFTAAARFADAALDDCDYFSENQTYEIGSFYTKNGCPVLVDLVMYGYYPYA